MSIQPDASTIISDNVERDLGGLLEAFGSRFSLEDIASAYCQAKRDVNVAAEILFSKDKTSVCTDIGATSLKLSSRLENAGAKALKLASDIDLRKFNPEERNTRALKSKSRSSSMGTVSGVIGKEYIKSKPLKNDSWALTKPVKFEPKESPISGTRSDEIPSSLRGKNETKPASDVEEFLLKILGDGFQLNMTQTHDIPGRCGYDMQKSLEKLIILSASSLEKFDDIVEITTEKSTEKCPSQEFFRQQERLMYPHSAQSDGARSMSRNLTESSERNKDRNDRQNKILESLLVLPERSQEAPKRTHRVRSPRRSRAFSKLVVESNKDSLIDHTVAVAEPQEDVTDVQVESEEDEDNYEDLRKAVKEYWNIMKEYYKAAVDAYVKGEPARADRLLEQGHFYKQRAREADEKSAKKIIEPRDGKIMCFDWHTAKPKEAVRLLRLHLPSISGITGIKYLRVKVGANKEDRTKKARIRRSGKQLQKESIRWTVEENGLTILIQVDIIDPGRLSFAKRRDRR